MNTYPIHDEKGCLIAFEIENAYIGTKKLASLLSSFPRVSGVSRRKLFSADDEFRVGFDYYDIPFVVLEPFGDSSRYWVGPRGGLAMAISDRVGELEQMMGSYSPPFLMRLIGDIVTLKLIRSLKKGFGKKAQK